MADAPAGTPLAIARTLREFESRRRYAEQTLCYLVEELQIGELLRPAVSWAIVGGAVRDALLVGRTQRGFSHVLPWPDMDLAVADGAFSLPDRDCVRGHHHFRVQRNSYDGWKATAPSWELDIWSTPHDSGGTLGEQDWEKYLDGIDFALNAVAFIWPQKKVVVHSRWAHSLRTRSVYRVGSDTPRPHLRPIRATALAAKMSAVTGCRFSVGDDMRDELAWLFTEDSGEAGQEARSYLRHKTDTGRWPRAVLRQLLHELRAMEVEQNVLELVNHVFGVRVRALRAEVTQGARPRDRQLPLW